LRVKEAETKKQAYGRIKVELKERSATGNDEMINGKRKSKEG
jgi:hypothetical protein